MDCSLIPQLILQLNSQQNLNLFLNIKNSVDKIEEIRNLKRVEMSERILRIFNDF